MADYMAGKHKAGATATATATSGFGTTPAAAGTFGGGAAFGAAAVQPATGTRIASPPTYPISHEPGAHSD